MADELQGTKVDVVESTGRFSDVTLSDGTTLRVKATVTEARRVDGEWDANGRPIYSITSVTIFSVADVTDQNLMKQG